MAIFSGIVVTACISHARDRGFKSHRRTGGVDTAQLGNWEAAIKQ